MRLRFAVEQSAPSQTIPVYHDDDNETKVKKSLSFLRTKDGKCAFLGHSLSSKLPWLLFLFVSLLLGGTTVRWWIKDHDTSVIATKNEPLLPRTVTPLRPIDRELYTIRINTWRRNKQLLASIAYHSTCPGVAQIQVVWCDPEEEPPEELFQYEKVIIERHEVNSLNERFHIIESTPTLGILSMDDDVLRSCDAIDAGFFKWTQNPHRMVGFDARPVLAAEDGTWEYGYLSAMKKTNRYSISLSRFAFIHRDYLDWYMSILPKDIFNKVSESLNCEDIAMSFFISSFTNGSVPLLADFWAMESQVKLVEDKAISKTKGHKHIRDNCTESFGNSLNLKGTLQEARVWHLFKDNSTASIGRALWFNTGAVDYSDTAVATKISTRQTLHLQMVEEWKSKVNAKQMQKVVNHQKVEAGTAAYEKGLVPDHKPWHGHHSHKESG